MFNTVVFESDKAELLPTSNAELSKLAMYLKQNGLYKIEVLGHTDNTGKEQGNTKLSEARAKAVADYIIGKGINSARVSFKGYGSSKPLFPNDTEEHKQANRRVEFILKEE